MSKLSHAALPQPRTISIRGLSIGLASLIVFSLLYVLVVREYQVEGNLTTSGSTTANEFDVLVIADPSDFDARTNTMNVLFEFIINDPDLLDDGERLSQGIRVTIFASDGVHEVRFAEGEPIGNADFEIRVEGEVYAYPLDTYSGFLGVVIETFERGAGGINETTGSVQPALNIAGSISGWDIQADIEAADGQPLAIINLNRAFSTKAFAVVLLGMAISVVVLAFIAALLTVSNRRRFEVALLTWNGAILFALPLLRTYLPGSPPIGAAIDIYIYLWVFVFAVISLVVMVIAWSEQRKADLLDERIRLGGQ